MAKKRISVPERIFAFGILATGIATIFAYIFHPVDLIPDTMGIWGYIDDAIVTLVISRITMAVGKILTGHKELFKMDNPFKMF